jgi:hypothetical protein
MKQSHSRGANSRSATHKYPVFNKTKSFITTFTKARHFFVF